MISSITNKKYGLYELNPTVEELTNYYNQVVNGKLYGAVKTARDGDKKLFLEDCDDEIGFGIYRVFPSKESCNLYISTVCAKMEFDRSTFALWESNQEAMTETLIKLNEETVVHFGNTIVATGCDYRKGHGFVIMDIYWSGNQKSLV